MDCKKELLKICNSLTNCEYRNVIMQKIATIIFKNPYEEYEGDGEYIYIDFELYCYAICDRNLKDIELKSDNMYDIFYLLSRYSIKNYLNVDWDDKETYYNKNIKMEIIILNIYKTFSTYLYKKQKCSIKEMILKYNTLDIEIDASLYKDFI